MLSPELKSFPDLDKLVSWAAQHPLHKPVTSNLHIHTPYSFSAFADIHEAVSLAREQGVLVLGISDFNTIEGYDCFTEECQKAGVFPVYCMETIALSVEDQATGKRWNDPGNPGIIYFCGKGLRYPARLSQDDRDTLLRIAHALEARMRQMIEKINRHLENTLPNIRNIRLYYEYIRDNMTAGTVRERHLAKALHQTIAKSFPGVSERTAALKSIYGIEGKVNTTDEIALQEELRSNLLKAGKVAFVEESPEAYLGIEEARSLILNMGGIPCYPVLADGAKGELTEIERNPEFLCDEILRRGVYCIEFIPTRNDINMLRNYVSVFRKRGMLLTAGTEHNTPKMEPMAPGCRGEVELDEALKEVFWQGARVVAAHQYLTSIGQNGYVDASGNRTDAEIQRLESIGEAVIAYDLANYMNYIMR